MSITISQFFQLLLFAFSAKSEMGAGKASTPGDSDAELFVRYQQGESHAFRILFQKWKLPLISYFYRSLGNRADAEELTLDVFKRLHTSGYKYQKQSRFSTYLFTIARNLMLNRIRSQTRRPLDIMDPSDLVYTEFEDAADHQVSFEQEQALSQALSLLNESHRTPLLLTLQQGMQPREIARIINQSENSTRVLLHRAKQKLSQLLKDLK